MSDSESNAEAAMRADIPEPKDEGEPVSLMEPTRISEDSRHREALTDLAVNLAAHSAGFRRSLPQGVLTALADLVRAMNCYYSNLIEGHDNHPVDIERALKNDYSSNPEQRNLQLEAKAHVAVQQWIDEGGLRGRVITTEGICEVHRCFGDLLPEDLLWVEEPATAGRLQVFPGKLRRLTSRSDSTYPSVPVRYRDFWNGSSVFTAASARRRPSSPQRPPITDCCGSTRFWTAMAEWHV